MEERALLSARHFVEELAQKAHCDSMRKDAEKLIRANAPDEEIVRFLMAVASSYYCSCNYCEEKTAARIVLAEVYRTDENW